MTVFVVCFFMPRVTFTSPMFSLGQLNPKAFTHLLQFGWLSLKFETCGVKHQPDSGPLEKHGLELLTREV